MEATKGRYDSGMNERQSERFLGIAIPVALLAFAVWAAWDGEVILRGRHGAKLTLRGLDVGLYVAACACLGAATHAKLFWGNDDRLAGYGEVATIVAAIGFIIALCAIVGRQLFDFI